MDFIVNKNDVDLIEINPRFVASIPFFTKMQIQDKQLPFLLLHILEFLNNKTKNVFQQSFREWDKENNFNASQLILRNIKNKPVKIRKSLTSGIYEVKNNKLTFKKKVYYMKRDLNNNEFLIQCVVKNSIINPDMEYANIQTGYGIMENERKFKDCFNKVVNLVLKNINLSF